MTKLLVVYWEWTNGPHKGGRFWASHNVENDGRLRDWPEQGLRALGASTVDVMEGVGLELIAQHANGEKQACDAEGKDG